MPNSYSSRDLNFSWPLLRAYDPAKTQAYAKLEVECGLFSLKEAIYGEIAHTYRKRKWRPVEEYLKGQGRFRHLFEPVRQRDHPHYSNQYRSILGGDGAVSWYTTTKVPY